MKKFLFASIFIIILLLFVFKENILYSFHTSGKMSGTNNVLSKNNNANLKTVADHLTIPWEIAFLPNEDMLVTERPGNLVIFSAKKTAIKIADVAHVGEGGLLGLAIHPNFSQNHWIYLYLTSKTSSGLVNRVVRYQLSQNNLQDKKIIIDNIPGAHYHDGGRIVFGPDKKLYITTGDATHSNNAQNINTLSGKILRLNDDGSIPKDNPFGNPIYCYGLRNAQGLAWDDNGNLWATDHGRSFVLSGYDELNLIKPGKNYGWPVVQGNETKAGMIPPVIQSGPNITWAPAGAIFYRDNIFFAGLRGASLYQYNIKTKKLQNHFFQQFGRIRAVTLHNGYFYISTSNLDGRGKAKDADDKVIRIDPSIFKE